MKKYFTQVVEKHAREIPDNIAYIFSETEVTWREYYEDINRVTNAFLNLGLQKGDKISTLLPISGAFLTVYMAAANMGLVLVPMDARSKAREMIKICQRTQPKLLVTAADNERTVYTVKKLVAEIEIPHLYSFAGSLDQLQALPYESLLEHSSEPIPDALHPDLDDPLEIVFSSGTTGTPKGAIITHRNSFGSMAKVIKAWNVTSRDTFLLNMPTSHIGGTHTSTGIQLFSGATAVLMPKYDPAHLLALIEKHQITMFGGVTTMFRLLFRNSNIADYNLHSVKRIFVSGETTSPEMIHQIKAVFPHADVSKTWGMTETTGPFTVTERNQDIEIVAATEGKPMVGNTLKIIRTDGSEAAPHEAGEIVVQGESVIKRYLDDEHQSSFVDGWFRTGDQGYLDEDNNLYFIGRLKDMYISGGYNVYPAEIEAYINTYPGVNSSCVIPISDDLWGESGVAFIIPEEGAQLDTDQIMQYCRDGLADYKRPKHIVVRTDLPQTLIGKIAKKEIRENVGVYMS